MSNWRTLALLVQSIALWTLGIVIAGLAIHNGRISEAEIQLHVARYCGSGGSVVAAVLVAAAVVHAGVSLVAAIIDLIFRARLWLVLAIITPPVVLAAVASLWGAQAHCRMF